MESCPAQAVLPLVGLTADKVIRDRYKAKGVQWMTAGFSWMSIVTCCPGWMTGRRLGTSRWAWRGSPWRRGFEPSWRPLTS
ncbi:MAG: hypothetical protein ACQESR_21985 [Planctomycetota bacterium]